MTTSYTGALRLTKPGVGDPTVKNQWGALVNNDMDLIDAAITGVVTIDLTGINTLTLTAINGATDQARPFALNFTGTPTGSPCPIILPSVVKFGIVQNGSSQTVQLQTLAGGGASVLTLVAGSGWVYYYCDGTNVASILTISPMSSEVIFNPNFSSQTWAAPQAGLIQLRMWGAGGLGGNSYTLTSGAGGGGGGGGYVEVYLNVTAGQQFTIYPGQMGGLPYPNDSTFASTTGSPISFTAGAGSAGGNANAVADGVGGAAGVGTFALNKFSTPGQNGQRQGSIFMGGAGGSSFGSAGGLSFLNARTIFHQNSPGAGGSGGVCDPTGSYSSAGIGTNGGPGLVVISF